MATTTNYSWTTPDDTGLVKDGASAIRALGTAIDTSMNTALGTKKAGMVLVSSTTIGSAVSSVAVTGAFSTTYDNYRIIITGGTSSANSDISMKLGSTAAGYYQQLIRGTYSTTISGVAVSNGAGWTYAGDNNGASNAFFLNIYAPFLSQITRIDGIYVDASYGGSFAGYLNNTTSYTDFTLTPASGTLTGGRIDVYGYNK